MAQTEDKFWTFSKAMGTLAGSVGTAVVAALLIHHFTEDKVYPEIGLTGIVLNSATKQPIVDALVTAVAGSSIASVKTDSEGRYSFVLTGTASGTQSISVDIVAGGFAFFRSPPLIASAGDNYVKFPLSSTTPAAPGAPAEPAPLPPTSFSRFQPQVLKVLPANFRKPEITVKLSPK